MGLARCLAQGKSVGPESRAESPSWGPVKSAVRRRLRGMRLAGRATSCSDASGVDAQIGGLRWRRPGSGFPSTDGLNLVNRERELGLDRRETG